MTTLGVDANPPSYFSPLHPDLPPPEPLNSGESLPVYVASTSPNMPRLAARPSEPKEFEYKFDKSGNAVAILKVVAEALYSRNIPTFLGTGPVKGSVCLNLKEPDMIQSVVVSIKGRMVADLGEEISFLDVSRTLWSQASDRLAPANSTDPIQPPLANAKGKLQGNYTWTFALDIPKEVSMPEADSNRSAIGSYVPPQTFIESLRGRIKHNVSVRIARGKLKTDHRFSTPFEYIPVIRPPPFPPLKTLSYQEGMPLMDPTVDLNGWHSSESISISSTLFKARGVDVRGKLFISSPLVYTRGSVIPLYLHLQSSDQQAVDLLVSSKSIVVRLKRRVRFHVPPGNLNNMENLWVATGRQVRNLAEAVWWPAAPQDSSMPTDGHIRCMNGELHLNADLKPTSAMPVFKIEYSVVLCLCDTAGSEMPTTKVLFEQPVDIVTSFAPGPRAVRYAPPGYDSVPR